MLKTFFTMTCSAVAIMAATSQPVAADPISLAVASTVSAVFSAGGVASFTFLGFAAGWASVLASVVVRAALGYALNALARRPDANDINRGYRVNNLGSALPHQVIYGQTRVGGAVFYQSVTGGTQYLHRAIAMAGHEIQGYVNIFLNDESVTLDGSGNVTAPSKYNGYVRIKTHLGTDAQTADTDMVSEIPEWTTNHRAQGIAYIYARFNHDGSTAARELFQNGIPVVTAIVQGKKVYDPRSDTTGYSTNSALCIRDYVSSDFGLAEADSEINDTLFGEAADVCDEIAPSGYFRYTCNGSFLLDAAPADIITALTASMGGLFWFLHGQWACRAAKFVPPTLELGDDDLRTNLQIATKHSRRDNFNTVRGVYRGAATFYQEDDYPEVTDSSFVAEDNGEVVATQLDLMFTDTVEMAQRIAKLALRRNRKQVTVTAGYSLKAIDLKVGDTVTINNSRAGWTGKLFEVVDWRFGLTDDMDLATNLVLREIDQSVYQ